MAIQLALFGPVHRLPSPTLQYRVLPTVHRQALYEGLLAVDRKWWNAPLRSEDRRRVRRAIRFDSFVVMLDAGIVLRTACRSGSVPDAARAARRLTRAALRWACLPIRFRQNPVAERRRGVLDALRVAVDRRREASPNGPDPSRPPGALMPGGERPG
jgi:hypothetical protein